MRISRQVVRSAGELGELFSFFDEQNDGLVAGFDNYPAPSYTAYNAGGMSTGGVAVLVGNVITAFETGWQASDARRDTITASLIEALKEDYAWLVVHDTDDPVLWTQAGFTPVAPPADCDDPVHILVWGETPPIDGFLRSQGLRWSMKDHRWGGQQLE
jgi:hypothetical protein